MKRPTNSGNTVPARLSAFTPQDLRFMQAALAQARRGLGRTHPNPAVGAVVVKGNRIVATGYHRKAGKPHAEAEALAVAAEAARGATLYVTLEPCCHTGRTGPCTESVINAGIARVVIGCLDANPKVNGAGVKRLKKAGIAVDLCCLEDECFDLNRAFFCWIKNQRPLVTLKFAATLDGIIGEANAPEAPPHVRFITGDESRAYVHDLRSRHDAILVGLGTVQTDDPQLNVRAKRLAPGGKREVLRVVLDSHLRTPLTAKVLVAIPKTPRTLLLAAAPARKTEPAFFSRQQQLTAAGAEVVVIDHGESGLDLRLALQVLAQRGVQSLLVEGGSRVHASFIAAGFVDEIAAFFAPKLAGGGVPIVTGIGLPLGTPLHLTQLQPRSLGQDLLIEAKVVSGAALHATSARPRPRK